MRLPSALKVIPATVGVDDPPGEPEEYGSHDNRIEQSNWGSSTLKGSGVATTGLSTVSSGFSGFCVVSSRYQKEAITPWVTKGVMTDDENKKIRNH
eukprot:CAMPEP_0167794314 /NCGR_PEP_ID=MMETSP0111_2-20121227/13731_1 /TAXON_ID=91324 /ORGANISM="Lotharella globosa, Strain CCCM811" /LENGTH=95 /DNA_ID=CAMNT_0007687697 /DNA_START=272 /DNA_END=560 /DNA_ORIENTATION=+